MGTIRRPRSASVAFLAGLSGVDRIGTEWHRKVGEMERLAEGVVFDLQLH